MTTEMTTEIGNGVSHQIVVGVDGSDASLSALRWAVKLAPTLDATIEVVVAWEYPYLLGLEAGMPQQWHPEEDAKEILRKSLKSVFGDTLPIGLVSGVHQGHAAEVLLKSSKTAQMLIIGSRGLGGFKGLLLGSVSATCAEHAICPVLVLHS